MEKKKEKTMTQMRQAGEMVGWRAQVFPFVFALLTFLSMSSSGSRVFAIFLTAGTILFGIGRHSVYLLKERVTLLFFAVSIYAGLCFAAGLYSDFGNYAIKETAKTLCAYDIFVLAVLGLEKKNIRLILQTLAGSCAAFGVISIDGSSLNILTPAFAAFMRLFQVGYDLSTMGYETGVRITGVFSNANVLAGLLAFGILLSLYLHSTTQSKRGNVLYRLLLGVNSMAFFLCFSMGAMAAFFLSCLIYLFVTAREERLQLFFVMIETLITTVALSFVAYAFLGKSGAVSAIPLLCALTNGILINKMDHILFGKLVPKLTGSRKTTWLFIGLFCTLIMVYGVLAINLTSGIAMQRGEMLTRAAYLNAGEYTISEVKSDGKDEVTIYSQNESELMMHTQTVLYTGTLTEAVFVVPENSRVVWFDITTQEASTLTSVTLSDGTALKLGYRLLPGFAANRLQGLRANQNFIQRLVFFRDGIKLWKQSPIFGFGLAGVEGRLTQVQSFYYETKYIHNHFIQVLDEMGLVGFTSFIFLIGSAVTLLIRRRKERTPLFSVLAACMTMVITHSLTEVVWSTAVYQVTIFLIFAVCLIVYGTPIARLSGKATCSIITAGMCLFPAVSALLLGGTTLASVQMQAIENGEKQVTTRVEFLGTMKHLIKMDVYDNEYYKLNYIMNALATDDSLYLGQAAAYAAQLRKTNEYTACSNVATYYDLPLGHLDDFFADSLAAITQEASNKDAWNNQFNAYREAFSDLKKEDMGDYVSGILSIRDALNLFNSDRMEQIILTKENQTFLDLIASVQAQDSEQIYSALSQALE